LKKGLNELKNLDEEISKKIKENYNLNMMLINFLEFINDIKDAVDAMRLKGQIVTHYNSDGSVESFELTNLFYDEEELQNLVDAYNESLIQTQSSNQAITVEDLIESFANKLFNPDATDEQLKDIDCYTEWYGHH
jgi:hypothetical protein